MKYLAAGVPIIDPNKTNNLPRIKVTDTHAELARILTLTFIIIGAISLMLLVIAGFRYTISSGDPTKVADTKRAIIYTFVGLVVAASAAIIVNAVLGQTTQGQ